MVECHGEPTSAKNKSNKSCSKHRRLNFLLLKIVP